jgi:hypothetical protein
LPRRRLTPTKTGVFSVANGRLTRTPGRVISYINILWKQLTYAGAWSAGRPRPVEHTRTSHPDVLCGTGASEATWNVGGMARTPSIPQAGEAHRPYPALSRFAPQNKILLFPPQTSTPPPFSHVNQPQGRMGAEYFCGGAKRGFCS